MKGEKMEKNPSKVSLSGFRGELLKVVVELSRCDVQFLAEGMR